MPIHWTHNLPRASGSLQMPDRGRWWFQHLRRAQSWPAIAWLPASVQYWLCSKHIADKYIPQMEVRLSIDADAVEDVGHRAPYQSTAWSKKRRLPVVAQPDITASPEARKWKTLDHNKFCFALLQSEVCNAANHPHSAEEYFDRYDSVRWIHVGCQAIGSRRQRPLWPRGWTMTVSDYVVITNNWRNATESWAQLQTAWNAWVQQERHRHKTDRQNETIYWNVRLSADSWRSSKKTVALTELAGGPVGTPRTKQTSRTVFSALQVLDFFNAKVNAVQTTVGQSPAVWKVWRVFCR